MFLHLSIFATVCTGIKLPLRIFGGNDANPDEYPYVVRLELQRLANFTNNTITAKHYHMCTASALSSTWALTAAHCLTSYINYDIGFRHRNKKLVVRYGHVLHSPWINDSFSDVLFVIKHPSYTYTYKKYTYNRLMKNDIGIVKTTPMNIKEYVKLSAVDYLSLYGHEAIIAGFGITNVTVSGDEMKTGSTLELKKPLQVLKVLISKCLKKVPLSPAFCLAPRCGHRVTSCGGDSGGPLLHQSGLVGVLSLGEMTGDCLRPFIKRRVDIAGIFLPVSPYIEWIYSHVTF